MTTTWSFLFFLAVWFAVFITSPITLFILGVMLVILCISAFCQWNLVRTGRVPPNHWRRRR